MGSPTTPDQVAIVGMAALLPGARDLQAYWRNLRDGIDAITDLPAGRWDERFHSAEVAGTAGPRRPDRWSCRRGGFIDDLAEVEVTRFGLMPSSVSGTEPDQLIALQVAADAIADAGGQRCLPDDRTRVGVILGRGGYMTPAGARLDQRVRTANQLVHTLGELIPDLGPAALDRIRSSFTAQLGPYEPESAIGLVPNIAASRIANRLDLHGPAYTIDAACASSLVAVDSAIAELVRGRCDLVLAGGVHHSHDVMLWSVFTQLGALSSSQRIRPFDRAADGLLIGEGTGVVVLKRLADAMAAGDRIYAVIRGSAVASDGRATSLMNPASAGQVRAVRAAWRAAGLDPGAAEGLGLIEAHGTAMPAGDAAELQTLAEVFGPPVAGESPVVIGSVKSMIGHAMPAAGIAGLIKSTLAVYHGVLLPTLHCDDPHPALLKTRFRPITTARPWECPPGRPVRRAGVNAFGFGGINAHVLIEQAPGGNAAGAPPSRPHTTVTEPERVLRFAARSPARLARLLDVDDATLLHSADPAGRPVGAGPVRLGIVAPTPKRLGIARAAVAGQRPWRGRSDVWFSPVALLGGGAGKLAFIFPGLEAGFAPRVAGVAEYFGLPVPPVPADPLTGIGRHGVAVLHLGRLLHDALNRMNIVPDGIAGHSVGEWTGMICAGYLSTAEVDSFFEAYDPDALQVPGLAFAMLGAAARQVTGELGAYPEVVLSHDNSPNQTIVCGPVEAVRELIGGFRRRGVVAALLPFQSGFHTPMLAPYLTSIKAVVGQHVLHPPRVAMWSATTASPYPDEEHEIRELMFWHLVSPVRFRPLIEAMHADGFTAFVQLGHGQLGSLIGDTLRGREHLVIAANSTRHDGLAQLRRVATALWVDGLDVSGPDAGGPGVGVGGSAVAVTGPGGADRLAVAPPVRSAVRLDLRTELVSLPAADLAELAGYPHPAARDPIPQEPARKEPVTDPPVNPPTVESPEQPGEFTGLLRVSTETMPYLLDHCFFTQRPDWPDVGDRHPVLPATTLIAQLADVAERRAPGSTAVAVRDIALNRWLAASPPVDVTVCATPPVRGVLKMSVGQYATATVELADAYPAQRPAVWSFDPAAERVPDMTAADLYRRGWMFHGPAFQGITELTAIGQTHVRGVLSTPPAPGGLLDNLGQLLGYWIMATHRQRSGVFPIAMQELRFYGPHPPPGARLTGAVRITSVDRTLLTADMQLVRSGRVWAQVTGWVDRRFDSDPVTMAMERARERNTLSRRQPGDWELVFERWPDLASRELMLRKMTGAAERDDYQDCRPPDRRGWLLERIAVKDAVRRRLWDHGAGPIFPAEIRVCDDTPGRPAVSGMHGRVVPELAVSSAHSAQAGVAIVRPRRECAGVGIDLQMIGGGADVAPPDAMAAAERELLEQAGARSGEPETLWITRFHAAKAAAARVAGPGAGPAGYSVLRAEPEQLLVVGPGGQHQVQVRQVGSPTELSTRNYVVAWTVKARKQSRSGVAHE